MHHTPGQFEETARLAFDVDSHYCASIHCFECFYDFKRYGSVSNLNLHAANMDVIDLIKINWYPVGEFDTARGRADQ